LLRDSRAGLRPLASAWMAVYRRSPMTSKRVCPAHCQEDFPGVRASNPVVARPGLWPSPNPNQPNGFRVLHSSALPRAMSSLRWLRIGVSIPRLVPPIVCDEFSSRRVCAVYGLRASFAVLISGSSVNQEYHSRFYFLDFFPHFCYCGLPWPFLQRFFSS